ncbi:hypothetical protein EOPP23_09970 [Endozoicomonas sp. OPT23]|uniref:BamA/TamA family outer membrane protein n=1 Tax=Endozoicomonas sp. OPT23 TaxID=2072845 RepID=UPI00129AC86E|nr:BamA/TamA family outer membrane protein [Endozoicomonas sp. OPT23]MRI33309.1 hypothetical protein [Endozoicomonas sp. OPT23]
MSTIRKFALGALAASISMGVMAEDAAKTAKDGNAKIDGAQFSMPAGPMYDPDFDFAVAAIPTMVNQFDEGSRPSFTKFTMVYGSNDNWNLGFETDYYFLNDNWRFLNYLGYTDADFTLSAENGQLNPFNTVSVTDWGSLTYKVTDSMYAGLAWKYSQLEMGGRDPSDYTNLTNYATDDTTVQFGPEINYNTRDNKFYPTSGAYVKVNLFKTKLDKEKSLLGIRDGEFEYETVKIDARHYTPLSEKTTLAFRGGLEYNTSEAPDKAVTLNGTVRDFQGLSREGTAHSAVTGEAYVRHWFNDKWGMSTGVVVAKGFGGFDDQVKEAGTDKTYMAGVVGVRYMLIPESKLSLRIDFSYNNQEDENSLLYFRVGEAF